MEQKPALTQSRLKEVLSYNPETGVFLWLRKQKGVTHSGRPAGCVSDSGSKKIYIKIRVDRVLYFAHRLAWLWVHGEWPQQEIDHIDGNSSNNRIANLRLCTSSQNKANRGLLINNSSGYKGVVKHGNRWVAQASLKGTVRYLGTFDDPKEAARKFDERCIEHHGKFAVTNKLLGLL